MGAEKPFMTNRPILNVGSLFVALVLLLLSTHALAAQADWKKDWEQTVAAANKEGQVNVYIYRYEGVLQEFKRDYPGINVVSVTGRSTDLTNRVMSERRAGRLLADGYISGPGGNVNVLYE